MRMRRFILLATLLLGTVGFALAQVTEKSPIDLSGVWQMCFYRSSSPEIPGELKTSNSFKILSEDGRFTNMVMMPQGAIIIGEGKYKVSSPTSFTETVERNLHLPQLEGKDNVLQFRLDGDDIMVVKFFLKEDINGNVIDTWVYETWKKVEMPDTYPSNIIR